MGRNERVLWPCQGEARGRIASEAADEQTGGIGRPQGGGSDEFCPPLEWRSFNGRLFSLLASRMDCFWAEGHLAGQLVGFKI